MGFSTVDRRAFYKQIKAGDEVPPLERTAELEGYKLPELFGGFELATDDATAEEKARSLGVESIHTSKVFGGPYMLQFISEMITEWLPNPKGWVEGGRLSANFIKLVRFNERIICRGKVKKKEKEGARNCLICDVWIENAEGEKVVVGEAMILLPQTLDSPRPSI